MRISNYLATGVVTIVVATGLFSLESLDVRAQSTPASPVGAWFGIARSCTTPSRFPQPPNTVDQSICREACGGRTCPATTFPVDEVTMLPQLFADGNVVATDHLSLFNAHTTGQGRWDADGKAVIDGRQYDRITASFLWLHPAEPQNVDPKNPLSRFLGIARPRFVMYLDSANPDVIKGYLQAYLFSITDKFGVVNLQPGTPFPTPDPVAPLPRDCDPTVQSNPYCAGTFMFVIRRVHSR